MWSRRLTRKFTGWDPETGCSFWWLQRLFTQNTASLLFDFFFYFYLIDVRTGWSMEIYPSKNSNKNITKRRMKKKNFYKTFQKYLQNIMNIFNVEMAAFRFDDECETGFHWSARTSYHFFVQLGLSWLNDCLQGVQVGVVTSWNIPLQSWPDSKVHRINIRVWRCPHLLVEDPSRIGPAPPHWQPKAQGPLCEQTHRPVRRFICSQKLLWGKEELFFATCSRQQVVDFQAFTKKHQTRLDHVWCNIGPNQNANKFIVFKLTSDYDWWVSRAKVINSMISLNGHSLHREHLLAGPNEDLAGGWQQFPKHQLAPIQTFQLWSFWNYLYQVFLFGINCKLSIITRRIENLWILAYLAIFDASLRISLYLLLRCKSYGLRADCARSYMNRLNIGCAWLLELCPSIVKCYPIHFELFHIFVSGDASGLRVTIRSRFALLTITCRILEKKSIRICVSNDKFTKVWCWKIQRPSTSG